MTIRFERVSADVAPEAPTAPPAVSPPAANASAADDVAEQALVALQLRQERLARLGDE
jgi:hypothetical protein